MLLKMTEEPDDYEGPWPKGDAMTEWVMVPREPTEQMLVALANTPCRVGWPAKAYRAMLDAAPQQAEPVSYAVFDPSGEVVYAALSETRCIEYRDNEYRYGHSAAKHWAVRPVFAHPPAAEVQRLREAARLALDALTCGYGDDPDGTHSCGRCDSSVDRNSVVRAALRRALGGE